MLNEVFKILQRREMLNRCSIKVKSNLSLSQQAFNKLFLHFQQCGTTCSNAPPPAPHPSHLARHLFQQSAERMLEQMLKPFNTELNKITNGSPENFAEN